MTPEQIAENIINYYKSKTLEPDSHITEIPYEDTLRQMIISYVTEAVEEERKRWVPKTAEETEAFVDSQLQQNEILRAAIESHVNEKVLEERKAVANLIAAKSEKLKRDWGHRWESASESTKTLYAFLLDLHDEIFTDANPPRESKQESHGK